MAEVTLYLCLKYYYRLLVTLELYPKFFQVDAAVSVKHMIPTLCFLLLA